MKSKLDREILTELEGFDIKYIPSKSGQHLIMSGDMVIDHNDNKVELLKRIKEIKRIFCRKIKSNKEI